MLVVEDAAVIY